MTDARDAGVGWLTSTKVAVSFAGGLAGMVVLPRALEGTGGTALIWMTVFFLGIGGVALWVGFRELRERHLILNTPTSTVRSLAVGDVEVKGKARPVDGALTSPLTGADACFYRLEIKEKTGSSSGEGSAWKDVLSFERQTEFAVDDGTGQVRVDPEQARLKIEVEDSTRIGKHEKPPAKIREWAGTEEGRELMAADVFPEEEEGGIGGRVAERMEATISERARRHLTEACEHPRSYEEHLLAVGEPTYVFGGAYPREGRASATNAENLVIREHEGTGQFIVSDKSEVQQAEEGLFGAAVTTSIGIALVPTGVLALLKLLGLV